jgi:hypothetical protein
MSPPSWLGAIHALVLSALSYLHHLLRQEPSGLHRYDGGMLAEKSSRPFPLRYRIKVGGRAGSLTAPDFSPAPLPLRGISVNLRVEASQSPRSGRRHLAHGEPAVGQNAAGRIGKPRRGRHPAPFAGCRVRWAVGFSRKNSRMPPLPGLARVVCRQQPTAGSPWATGCRHCRGFGKGPFP